MYLYMYLCIVEEQRVEGTWRAPARPVFVFVSVFVSVFVYVFVYVFMYCMLAAC